MKKSLLTLLICLITSFSFASSIFMEGFEYANNDLAAPIGWTCSDQSWLCGYMEKDHNRIPHDGNWYAFTNAEDSWMFMPLYFSSALRYRPSFWAISDGTFEVEFWAGHVADPSQMTTMLFSATVSSGTYEKYSEFLENLPSDCEYFGIHAIASEGAYYLTIDDIIIDMVNRYDLEVTPYQFDTIMYPGSRITFEYEVQNTGFEDLIVFMTPYTDFFTNIQFTEDGFNNSSFPTVPNQVVHCSCSATLSPDISPGTLCWMDIMFTVSCDCVTRMATLWVTATDPTGVVENETSIKLFPNPASDHFTVEAEGLLRVDVTDALGRIVCTLPATQDDLRVDTQSWKNGIYCVSIVTKTGTINRMLTK